MAKSPSESTFTADTRKQSYHIHNLLWEDAEDFQLIKGSRKPKTNSRIHPKSKPRSFTFVLLNVLGSSIGNIWRFPAAAYLHGGGTFLVAYLILLIFVVKPIFYVEVAMGQFTGKVSGKWWCVCPAFRGIAIGQFIASVAMVSYYGAISSFSLLYFIQSFNLKIPWVICKGVEQACFNSSITSRSSNISANASVFSDLFFRENFLKEITSPVDGLKSPNIDLLMYLGIVWLFVGLLIYNGVKTTGTLAYVAATFPYILLLVMIINTSKLPGANKAIKYLFEFKSDKLNTSEIWYHAAIQGFFSLNASAGVASFLSSQRNFRHRLNRNICLITLLDVILLLLASSVVFATLGNLANVTGKKLGDKSVYNGGIELASVIYTDAIPKVSKKPEGLAVFFMLTLSIVGIGSTAVIMHSIMATVWEVIPRVSAKILAPVLAGLGFATGCLYLSPNGLSLIQIVDQYIAGGIMIHMAIWEVVVIAYFYGLEKYCKDMTFMTRRKIHVYWRVCMALITPGLLLKVFIDFKKWKIKYRDNSYPSNVLDICNAIQYLGEVMIILFMIKELVSYGLAKKKKKTRNFIFSPTSSYGPEEAYLAKDWKRFIKGLKRCSLKEMTYIPDMVLYPIKVLFGTLHDDVFN